ncbi:hypothetical protein ACFSHT_39500 [Paraburkholderia silviterrae]|uniref:Uncharacterized protein n=1 Tax=Paraburkholderia silviterrae TaxID=2528715 RepID=A0A4R5M121_9BURK|nr:hypothetical protein [Paraburkholderia silviterrae]TDG18897.1 hypothetical protein EYW47_32680 [Paraburkholderia silviterrae]
MKPPIFAQLRADLIVIALTTMFIQAVVFVAIVVLCVPATSFATPGFRLGVIGIVSATVLAVRWIERRAALDAIETHSPS